MIRVSGENALEFTQSLIAQKIHNPQSHRSYLKDLVDPNGQSLDQVLLTYFEKGKSFTGDETVEIACHGNPLIVNAISQRFFEKGCRPAERGEFSFRAFYNGKIDLVQAESIHSLVTTKVRRGSETFVEQLKGQLSEIFNKIQDNLITTLAHLEATIDFVEQDIDPKELKPLKILLEETNKKVEELLLTYDTGKSLQKDPNILLLGATNAGKSSLFNQFVESDRAIVTDVAGTTRDFITESRFLGNNSFQFVDSAGLRETENKVEKIGIQKSLERVEASDLVLYIIDSSSPGDLSPLKNIPPHKVFLVFNKLDLFSTPEEMDEIKSGVFSQWNLDFSSEKVAFVSSLTGEGVTNLLKKVEDRLVGETTSDGAVTITQSRHFNHLKQTFEHIDEALSLIENEESPDLISQELQMGLSEVYQLLGKTFDDEILDKIFSEFCIGK